MHTLPSLVTFPSVVNKLLRSRKSVTHAHTAGRTTQKHNASGELRGTVPYQSVLYLTTLLNKTIFVISSVQSLNTFTQELIHLPILTLFPMTWFSCVELWFKPMIPKTRKTMAPESTRGREAGGPQPGPSEHGL